MKTQIALINPTGWAVIGYLGSHSGQFPHPMPAVDCPVVDTRPVDPERVRKIIHSHSIGPEGIEDVDALIEELLDAGAECGCVLPEQSCRVCQLAARKAYGDAIPFQLEVQHDPAIAD